MAERDTQRTEHHGRLHRVRNRRLPRRRLARPGSGYAYQLGVPRVFVKLEGADPVGMVAGEQALTTNWDQTGQEIIAHLKQTGVL